MSNKSKDIMIKSTHTTFLMILSIYKILIEIILKQIKSHTNIGYVTIKDLKYLKIDRV